MRASSYLLLLITLLVAGCGDPLSEPPPPDRGPVWLPPHERNDLGPVARDGNCLCDAPPLKRDVQPLQPDLQKQATPEARVPDAKGQGTPDCSQVSGFQCGFMATCNGSVLMVQWHEHVMAGGHDNIVSFACTHTCSGACVQSSSWPQNGGELVQQFCK